MEGELVLRLDIDEEEATANNLGGVCSNKIRARPLVLKKPPTPPIKKPPLPASIHPFSGSHLASKSFTTSPIKSPIGSFSSDRSSLTWAGRSNGGRRGGERRRPRRPPAAGDGAVPRAGPGPSAGAAPARAGRRLRGALPPPRRADRRAHRKVHRLRRREFPRRRYRDAAVRHVQPPRRRLRPAALQAHQHQEEEGDGSVDEPGEGEGGGRRRGPRRRRAQLEKVRAEGHPGRQAPQGLLPLHPPQLAELRRHQAGAARRPGPGALRRRLPRRAHLQGIIRRWRRQDQDAAAGAAAQPARAEPAAQPQRRPHRGHGPAAARLAHDAAVDGLPSAVRLQRRPHAHVGAVPGECLHGVAFGPRPPRGGVGAHGRVGAGARHGRRRLHDVLLRVRPDLRRRRAEPFLMRKNRGSSASVITLPLSNCPWHDGRREEHKMFLPKIRSMQM